MARFGWRLAAGLVAFGLTVASAQASVIFATTNDTGANDPVSLNNSRAFSFTVPTGSDWSFGGGFFSMKHGTSTTLGVRLDLFAAVLDLSGYVATGLSLGSFAYANVAAFDAAPSVGGQSGYRDAIPFQFVTPVALAANSTYLVVMSSNTATGGNTNYFIKSQNFRIVTDANELPGTITIPTSTPEPASALVLAFGLAGLGLSRRSAPAARKALATV